jgi:hypothetical protein
MPAHKDERESLVKPGPCAGRFLFEWAPTGIRHDLRSAGIYTEMRPDSLRKQPLHHMAFCTPRYKASLEGWFACCDGLPGFAAEVSIAYIERSATHSRNAAAYIFEHGVLFDGLKWLRDDGCSLSARWRVDYWQATLSSDVW